MRVLIASAACGLIAGSGMGVAQAYLDAETPAAVAEQRSGRPSDFGQEIEPRGRGRDGVEAAQVVANRLRGSAIRSVTFDKNAVEGPNLRIGVAGSGGPAVDVRQRWLASLARGAVAEEMRSEEATSAELVPSASLIADDGSVTPLGIGSVAAGQLYPAVSDDEAFAIAKDAADKFGLRLLDVSVLRPLGAALEVSYAWETGDTAENFKLEDLRVALQGNEGLRFEGLLVSLEEGGELVARAGSAHRTGSNDLWFADGWDVRAGIVHGGLLTINP